MKLNIGTRGSIDGWKTVDLDGADVCHDLSKFPWPFEDHSVELIYSSHCLEHFDRETGVKFLEECYRILLPDGEIRISVPDLDKFITARVTNNYEPLGGYRWIDLNYLMGGDPDNEPRPEWRHYYAYSFASLAYTLRGVGFRNPVRCQFKESFWGSLGSLDNPEYEHISLYVEAYT